MRKSFNQKLHDACDPPARELTKHLILKKELDHIFPDYDSALEIKDLDGATADLLVRSEDWEIFLELEWRQNHFSKMNHYGYHVAKEVNVPYKSCFSNKEIMGYFISFNQELSAYLIVSIEDVSKSRLETTNNKYKSNEYMYKVPAKFCEIYPVNSVSRIEFLKEYIKINT